MAKSERSRRADFEVIAESIPHIVWLAEPDGFTDYFNERGTEYTGLPRQANYGWGWVEMVHARDADRARLGWEVSARTTTPFELSYRIRRSDGEYRWHAFRALPVRGPDGEVVKWIGTADDLAESPGADEADRIGRQTRELRALLRAIQPLSNEGFGFVDADVLEARVNAVLGASRGAVVVSPTADAADVGRDEPAIDRLQPRELAVLRLIAAGHTNTEMANLLGVSLRTVEVSRAVLRDRLGLRTRAELVRFARDMGLGDRVE